MATLLTLKNRKKVIDTIYRASGAMKAAAAVRIGKLEKTLQDFAISKSLVEAKEHIIMESVFLPFVMNQDAFQKADILIGCDKGMCGDFISNINMYFKHNRDNGNFWLLFGAKLELLAGGKAYFFANALGNEFDLFAVGIQIYAFLKQHNICELNLHHFSKDKIVKKTIFSKKTMQEVLAKNDLLEVRQIAFQHGELHSHCSLVPEEFAVLTLTTQLHTAILESAIAENKQRLFAMTNAKNNAESMKKIIARLYHKARQEKITKELTEITSGMI